LDLGSIDAAMSDHMSQHGAWRVRGWRYWGSADFNDTRLYDHSRAQTSWILIFMMSMV